MASLGEHAALTSPYRLAPCLWTLILDSGINKKAGLDDLSQSWNTLFRYKVFFFKVISSGIRYQTFYKSLAILVSYEDKSGYIGIRPSPTLTPPMRAGPKKKWKGGVHAVKIMIHYQYKFLGVICILCNLKTHSIRTFFFRERSRNFVYHKDFGARRVT